jgi:hypothetical protein
MESTLIKSLPIMFLDPKALFQITLIIIKIFSEPEAIVLLFKIIILIIIIIKI